MSEKVKFVTKDVNDPEWQAKLAFMAKVEAGEASGEMCEVVDGEPYDSFAIEELLGDDDDQDEIDEAIESAIRDDGLTEAEALELYGG
jgi:hypothetical protein